MMKSLDYVKEYIEEFEKDNMFDSRFTKRFVDFLPVEEWERFGFRYTGDKKFTPIAWTEANVLNQLKEDVEFGIEKSVGHRGISACLMFDVVKAWCKVLENGLDSIDYEDCWYGHKLFIAVDEMYHFGLVNDNTFDEEFFEGWS